MSREKKGNNKTGETERTMNWREGREYGLQRRTGYIQHIGGKDRTRDWREGRK